MAIKASDIIGFIKFENQIGLYQADFESWVLDVPAFCSLQRVDMDTLTKRKDGRFEKKLLRPVRKEDVKSLVAWFDKNAALDPKKLEASLDRMDYLKLEAEYEQYLPVVLYDFDNLEAHENPDLNPRIAFDDFLPDGWKNVVVEGFDALVPDIFVYWARFASRLAHRPEDSL